MRLFFAVSILISLCLISLCAAAQEVPLKGPNHDPNPQATLPRTYQGCVIKTNGRLALTDSAGTDYFLVKNARSTSGDSQAASKSLERYVGQEVRLRAAPINPSDPSLDERSVSSQEPVKQPKTLDVEDIAKVADHCSSPKKP